MNPTLILRLFVTLVWTLVFLNSKRIFTCQILIWILLICLLLLTIDFLKWKMTLTILENSKQMCKDTFFDSTHSHAFEDFFSGNLLVIFLWQNLFWPLQRCTIFQGLLFDIFYMFQWIFLWLWTQHISLFHLLFTEISVVRPHYRNFCTPQVQKISVKSRRNSY